MAKTFLEGLSQADYVAYGYAQVEPNHLSAQRTGQIYAQLPAAADIDVLENGQFVKYDYENGLVNFTGAGEWMLVYNPIKLYRDGQDDCDTLFHFAPSVRVSQRRTAPSIMSLLPSSQSPRRATLRCSMAFWQSPVTAPLMPLPSARSS